jgi:hypothetical protein
MARILKALGAAACAVAALVAVMAPAAQAEPGQLIPNGFPAIVTGQQQNGITFDIGAGPLKTVTCESQLDSTLEAAANPVTFRPTYANCVAEPEAMPTTVTLNDCDYRLGFSKPGTTGAAAATGTIQAAIACPDGAIEIHVYEDAMAHAGNEPLCTYDIAPQGPVAGGVYHNTQGMPDYVTATVQAGFTAKSTIGPAMVCGGNMFNQHLPITLTGDYTMKAFEDINGVEGELVDLRVG